jgi:cation/acetate symporter
VQAAEKALDALPRSVAEAQEVWTRARAANEARTRPLAGMQAHAEQFAGDPTGDAGARSEHRSSRLNFLALVFCLMVGTAGLPHILVRSYTTPSVREARESVTWSLFFITLLYVTAPALAVMVKFEVFNGLVGTRFDQLPIWIAQWSKVDASLLSVSDVNLDGILQLGEMLIGGDIVMLATPEIAGLPYLVSGMVAAGGLAAALSTADGLLLTISSALSHDYYYRMVNPEASAARRVTISKTLLLVVALTAAAVAVQKPADILFLVSAAFSFAGAAFFPALVLGVFWKRANALGALSGMVAGLGLTCYYMATTHPWVRELLGVREPVRLWWDIQPISAGVFGVPAGFAVMFVVSWLTPRPSDGERRFVDGVRMSR